MAETRLSGGKAARRKAPRLRAGRRLRERHNFVGFHGHGLLALIFFAIIALSVLGVGLGIASLTIFAVGNVPGKSHAAVGLSPSSSPSPANSLVGRPIDGTIVGLWLQENLIAIQPAGGQPVQATVTAKSTITLAGAPSSLADLIPGDAVTVTFSQGPKGTLLVATLQDIQTVPTNAPSGAITPLPDVTPTPTATPLPPPTPTPTATPPAPSPPHPPGP
ncbi:MAG TPA: hypothetical protein VNH38_08035 [Candidatus Dormibacteraeota bacterium]|nr:hypothetical protein [Candidatus Dormibacteraeota bacterium]